MSCSVLLQLFFLTPVPSQRYFSIAAVISDRVTLLIERVNVNSLFSSLGKKEDDPYCSRLRMWVYGVLIAVPKPKS